MTGKPNEVHDLVLFKEKKAPESKQQDIYSLENVDQENKIKIISELAPYSGNYRFSVLILNESSAPITEVKFRIKFPDFMQFNRLSPPTLSYNSPKTDEKGVKQINFEFEELAENTKKQISVFLSPATESNKGLINVNVTFVNNKDFVRAINVDATEITILPISIEPKIIPSNQISPFLQKSSIKKAIQSMGIGVEGEMNKELYFNHIEQILRINNFQVIAKDDQKKILWVFGNEVESKEEILVIGQIVANKIEFLATSKNHSALVSLLTKISNDFKKRLLSMGLIKNISSVFELECKFCGAILAQFPKKGASIECKNCHEEQVVW